ncbi:hypothetical protein [Pontixanthobacter luteolus]|uniref:hypothetical protein n=1 Tax=Pontixanthobacter luteolus TaxID=295089 RepID=UPI0023034305|nr:hypothetical protein [Pontixanthobacter luteolus]
MTAKVRIKAGQVEFEYEGQTELSVEDIKDLFSHIETLFTVPALAEAGDSHSEEPAVSSPSLGAQVAPSKKLAMNSIVKELDGKSASDVAVAAAASLQIFEKKETFNRADLLATMKKATMHYRETMSNNLTRTLATLVGTKFNEVSDGKYSLNAETYDQLVTKLA